ncbi:hypothetical protein HK096_003746, partial [Nowakowskiella sp. JEL0078]
MITYEDYQSGKNSCSMSLQAYFTIELFLRFRQDIYGRISLRELFEYLDRRTTLVEARYDFATFDEDLDGFLTENELCRFITTQLSRLHMPMRILRPEQYLITATRKFFFFLDPSRRGKVSIEKIVLSPILDEFFEVRDLNERRELINWFSGKSADLMY